LVKYTTMKTQFITVCMIGLCYAAQAQYNSENLTLASASETYRYEKLQLYPVRANEVFVKEHKDMGKYLTLKEAMEKKMIRISEVDNGEVNKLFIENVSKDTVMILAGEVVQGGKQDRMIGQDLVLAPQKGKQDVDVFCVEQGRWTARREGMSFNQYYSVSPNKVRKAGTVNKNQGEVWKEVAETTEKNDAKTGSGTLTALKDSERHQKDLERYTEHLRALASEPAVIGIVAVTGNQVLGADLFASHELFEKQYANLLASYASEAITSGAEVTLPPSAVKKYLDTILSDESRQDEEVEKKGTMLKQGKKKVHISTF
jgi:hypothetical protein